MPSVAAASGRSPIARSRSPNTERNSSHWPSGTIPIVNSTSGAASTGPSAGTRSSPGTAATSSPGTRLEFDEEWNTAIST